MFNIILSDVFVLLSFWDKQEKKKKKENAKTHAFKKTLSPIKCSINKFIVYMWLAWCIRLKNTQKVDISDKAAFYESLKNHSFRKLTTDFENRTKCQVETKPCVVFIWTTRPYLPP